MFIIFFRTSRVVTIFSIFLGYSHSFIFFTELMLFIFFYVFDEIICFMSLKVFTPQTFHLNFSYLYIHNCFVALSFYLKKVESFYFQKIVLVLEKVIVSGNRSMRQKRLDLLNLAISSVNCRQSKHGII